MIEGRKQNKMGNGRGLTLVLGCYTNLEVMESSQITTLQIYFPVSIFDIA